MHALSRFLSEPLPDVGAFDFQPRTRLIFGPDTLERVGELARDLGSRRVLVVTDKGIVAAGHAARAVSFLEAVGLNAAVHAEVRENPTTQDVSLCVAAARAAEADLLVGLGGGSSMDTAKGANFILSNGGEMRDYWGVGKATKPMLPLIAIPTTAGTGSECQSAALIADETTHQKMACLDPKVLPRIAILDPLLTVSQPQGVTACTGMDALVHSLETAVTRKRNGISAAFSRQAFRQCIAALPHVLTTPLDLKARANMQLGAAFSGLAIETSMLGAAHSAANPLTAHHGIAHGHAVGVMLPPVIRFNAGLPQARARYEELASAAGLGSVEGLVERVLAILQLAQMDRPLRELGVQEAGIPALAAEAAQQWTAGFNPRPITAADFEALYREVY